jgi:indole-3-glycerol phosphate synthase
VQAQTHWIPPSGVLGRLCERAALRAAALSSHLPTLRREALANAPPSSLADALRTGTALHVIAEIKRRAPSKGPLDETLDPGPRALAYASGGASAISVLTEPSEFLGSSDDLREVLGATRLPVLKKDFHMEPSQVWEARALGASALLLIVRALGPDRTARLADAAAEAGIEALFEVRDQAELEWALDAGAVMIGVNRRNLETLEIDDGVPERLVPLVPGHCVTIAESGIASRTGVLAAAALGADAVLVGSSLSRAPDGAEAVRALCGVRRHARGQLA